MRFFKFLVVGIIIVCFQTYAKDVDTKAGKEAIEKGAVIIDVRTDSEFKEGYYPNALHMENTKLLEMISKSDIDKNQTIVLYCRSGGRAGRAADMLTQAGYSKVINAGGLKDILPNEKTD